MNRIVTRALAGALTLGALAACSEGLTDTSADDSLAAAFLSVPLGFDNAVSTFDVGTTGGQTAFNPNEHHGGRGHGGPDRFSLMGGGLGGLFLGKGFDGGFGHGRHGDPVLSGSCTFSASTGRVTCEAETRHGLTIQRSAAYTDANGTVQSAFDSVTTNTINTRVSVSGTVTRRDSAKTAVQHASERTVSGLAKGSTQRTVNGASAGQETTTGADSAGAFTVLRVAGDTTKNVVIPVPTATTTHPYPASGTVIRSMKVTLTRAGATTTATRREVVTYDGSATASVQVTKDGVTTTCTLPLPHGRLNCPG
jgi:hypothetical protein